MNKYLSYKFTRTYQFLLYRVLSCQAPASLLIRQPEPPRNNLPVALDTTPDEPFYPTIHRIQTAHGSLPQFQNPQATGCRQANPCDHQPTDTVSAVQERSTVLPDQGPC